MTIRLSDLFGRLLRESLWGRLMVFLLAPLLVLTSISILSDYRANLAQATDAYDRALASSAVSLAALVGVHEGKLRVDLPPSAEAMLRTDPVDSIFFAVFDDGGRRIAGDSELEGLAPAGGVNPEFFDATVRGQAVRLVSYFARGPAGETTILVAETIHKREQSAARAATKTATVDLLLVLATLVTVFFGVRLALAPLVDLGAAIARRSPEDLRPLPDGGAPREVRPLVAAINQLMANLRSAHAAQQAFLSNAAHQLRTPVAGLQTQLELATESAPEEIRPRMEKLRDAFRRLSHLTHQMLALARSSADADLAHEFQPTDLARLCEEAASDFLDTALSRGVDLGFETQPASVPGSAWLLRELLSNLVDNAIRHAPQAGHVTVRCGVDGATARPFLEVEDNGPGIPAADRPRIFERFYRPAGGGTQGTGLGLAIVREVAQRHGAQVAVLDPVEGPGTRMRLDFPAP